MSAATLPFTMTYDRAVAETGIARSCLRRLAAEGKFQIRRSGKRALIVGDSLASYINSLPATSPHAKASR